MRPSRMVLIAAVCTAALAVQAQVPRDFDAVLALLQPAQRERLETQAARWRAMTPVERRDLRRRADAFDMSPVRERAARREAWSAWSQLTAAERIRLRDEALRIARLSPEERATLRARFDALDASTRRGWLLGPALGADYMRLQPLLAQVPIDEQAGVLRTLRAMTPMQRADLGVLVQRTPPAARDRLRRALVSTSDANRAAWLQLSLDK